MIRWYCDARQEPKNRIHNDRHLQKCITNECDTHRLHCNINEDASTILTGRSGGMNFSCNFFLRWGTDGIIVLNIATVIFIINGASFNKQPIPFPDGGHFCNSDIGFSLLAILFRRSMECAMCPVISSHWKGQWHKLGNTIRKLRKKFP